MVICLPNRGNFRYDNEGRLTAWQDAPASPTTTAQYLYDGEGTRVLQRTTTGGTTSTTVYVGNLEEVKTTGAVSTTTTYYYAGGRRIGLGVDGTLSYLATDLLTSSSVALNASGTATASQLYAPYGTSRYASGTMPTDYGYTGQRSDSATGLSYYGSRYYDPTVGQFTSADTVMDGLNRYGYVHGNPTSDTDPTGHIASCTSVITNVANIVSGTPTSPVDVAGNLGQCGMDGAFGVSNTKAEGVIGKQVWDKVLATYKKSGNYTYVTKEGAAAFKAATSGGAIAKVYASNLWPPSKMLPGRTTTAAEAVIKAANDVLTKPDLHRTGRDSIPKARSYVSGKNATLTKLGKVGKALGWAGALISFGISVLDDYSTHGDVGRAAIVGGVHAGFSMAGAWVGGALGGMAGGICGPGAVVCSPIFSLAGASAGAWAGDWVAGKAVDFVDSGKAAQTWNSVTSSASNLWNGTKNFLGFGG